MDLYCPAVYLTGQLSRLVEAALQQWGRAYFSITEKRCDAIIVLFEPESEFLRREAIAGKSLFYLTKVNLIN